MAIDECSNAVPINPDETDSGTGHHERSEDENVSVDDHESTDQLDSSEDEWRSKDDLSFCLSKWAVENGITHNAIGSLLGILRNFHSELPKDPRTLLATGKVVGIKSIAGGSYYHFGIADAITEKLLNDNGLGSHNVIQLQVNIDGLPLFKSSSIQFWPI